jgi:hypothetical protein
MHLPVEKHKPHVAPVSKDGRPMLRDASQRVLL